MIGKSKSREKLAGPCTCARTLVWKVVVQLETHIPTFKRHLQYDETSFKQYMSDALKENVESNWWHVDCLNAAISSSLEYVQRFDECQIREV